MSYQYMFLQVGWLVKCWHLNRFWLIIYRLWSYCFLSSIKTEDVHLSPLRQTLLLLSKHLATKVKTFLLYYDWASKLNLFKICISFSWLTVFWVVNILYGSVSSFAALFSECLWTDNKKLLSSIRNGYICR